MAAVRRAIRTREALRHTNGPLRWRHCDVTDVPGRAFPAPSDEWGMSDNGFGAPPVVDDGR